MTDHCDTCVDNRDPLKLVRDGTNQVQRARAAPDPAHAPVDERGPEHVLTFAARYAEFLNYFDLDGTVAGTWEGFFNSDVSVQLALASIEDVGAYRTTLNELMRSLEDPELPPSEIAMKEALGAVFDCVGSLARRLDEFAETLPSDHRLRATLGNLIASQLSPALRRLIGYYEAGKDLNVVDPNVSATVEIRIFGRAVTSFEELLTGVELSAAWPAAVGEDDWNSYIGVPPGPYTGAYGAGPSAVDRINHLATHNQFTAAREALLVAYARIVEEATDALQASFEWNGHLPHFALLIAFAKLLDHARADANTLTGRHLDFYYREVLRMAERAAEPGKAHVLVELAKQADSHGLLSQTLLKAGKDDKGDDAHFATDRLLVANRATVAEKRSLYRHTGTTTGQRPIDDGRIFASPVANSDDGLGAELTSPDQSWHPFANKVFDHGALTDIRMPKAEIGFGIASHYLWLAEGTRKVQIGLETKVPLGPNGDHSQLRSNLRCRLSTEEGWLDRSFDSVTIKGKKCTLELTLDGNDPPITPYDREVHGYSFATAMPVMIVTLRHRDGARWSYAQLDGTKLTGVTVHVDVTGLRTLPISNDHGPIDGSKPFLAFGPTPGANSSLVIGSKEIFQKAPETVTVNTPWMATPVAHAPGVTTPALADKAKLDNLVKKTEAAAGKVQAAPIPKAQREYLHGGSWESTGQGARRVDSSTYDFTVLAPHHDRGVPDLTPDRPYSTSSRTGFIRLRLDGGFGTDTYPIDLASWIAGGSKGEPPQAPVLPTAQKLTVDYAATQQIDFTASDAGGRYFHVTPFGHAEPRPGSQNTLPLLPRFLAGGAPAEAELYIGVSDLEPPQNLTLLVQVVDGTANPLVVKPDDHIHWTYLRGDEWVPFAADAVDDGTDGLLASGTVTLAVPRDASTDHTLLPPDMHWVRLAVKSASDAVCRVVDIAAQAVPATYVVPDNGSTSHTRQLPGGTITKLAVPDPSVKGITQPYPTFGGRPVETKPDFRTRVSERLRHKDRAITLWDYEHLILGSFPEIYQARCLNHTQYEPSTTGTGIYRELAPGHVTVVTIPDLAVPNPLNPLRPYTSLRVLSEIDRFLSERLSCFATLHVRNPRFEEVRVELLVRFRDGVDETFHVNQLKREITEFLSPWAFHRDAHPDFQGSVSKSVLVNFIEERPYVDYATDVRLFRIDPDTGNQGQDLDHVVGSRAISILVSVPAEQHGVTVIRPGDVHTHEHCDCVPETVS